MDKILKGIKVGDYGLDNVVCGGWMGGCVRAYVIPLRLLRYFRLGVLSLCGSLFVIAFSNNLKYITLM